MSDTTDTGDVMAVPMKYGKPQQDPFMVALEHQIEQLNLLSAASQGAREVMKQRKKQLREVLKYVQDKSNSVEDRVTFIQAKYTQMAQELIKLEKQHQETVAQLELTQKEREKAQDTLRRTNLVRDRLEDLCRQQQQQNKEVLESARRMQEEELSARTTLQARLETAIEEVTSKMDAEAEKRVAQIVENERLTQKLAEVLSQYETFSELVRRKDEETQLYAAKLEQQAALYDAQVERNEQLQALNDKLIKTTEAVGSQLAVLDELQSQNIALKQVNKDLKDQLDAYSSKFTEFQDTLVKSSQTFDGLKQEMATSAKLRGALAKERDDANARCQQASAQLAEALDDNALLRKQVAQLSTQLVAVEGVDAEEVRRLKAHRDTLERLCRTLTAQVKASKEGAGSDGLADDECVAVKAHVGGSPGDAAAQQSSDGGDVQLSAGSVSSVPLPAGTDTP